MGSIESAIDGRLRFDEIEQVEAEPAGQDREVQAVRPVAHHASDDQEDADIGQQHEGGHGQPGEGVVHHAPDVQQPVL